MQASVGAFRRCISGLLTGLWRETWLKAVVNTRAPSCHVSLNCRGSLYYEHTTPPDISINSLPSRIQTHFLSSDSVINRTPISHASVSTMCVCGWWKTRSSRRIDNFNNFICEKLQAKFINRHFYLKRRKMIRLAYKRKVVHMPETCIILTL